LIGFDKDPAALERAHEKLKALHEPPQITLIHGSFAEVGERIAPASLNGMMADLGMSSLQLGDAARGFSFQADGPLDMRMNPMSGDTAEQVVNHLDERELADVIYEFGEERRSRRIARAIVRSRPILTTAQLAAVISAAARPMNQAERRIHPATRTFQALRIFVNHELDDLTALLEATPRVLKPGGRVVVITFHSLEDRIVKDALRVGKDKYFVYQPRSRKQHQKKRLKIIRDAQRKMRAAERM
jgi:16S rRNA (cytosine1402-N4)-methyltransferase